MTTDLSRNNSSNTLYERMSKMPWHATMTFTNFLGILKKMIEEGWEASLGKNGHLFIQMPEAEKPYDDLITAVYMKIRSGRGACLLDLVSADTPTESNGYWLGLGPEVIRRIISANLNTLSRGAKTRQKLLGALGLG